MKIKNYILKNDYEEFDPIFYDEDRTPFEIFIDCLDAWKDQAKESGCEFNYDFIADDEENKYYVSDDGGEHYNYTFEVVEYKTFVDLIDEFWDAVQSLEAGYTEEQWQRKEEVANARLKLAEDLYYDIEWRIYNSDFDGFTDDEDYDWYKNKYEELTRRYESAKCRVERQVQQWGESFIEKLAKRQFV